MASKRGTIATISLVLLTIFGAISWKQRMMHESDYFNWAALAAALRASVKNADRPIIEWTNGRRLRYQFRTNFELLDDERRGVIGYVFQYSDYGKRVALKMYSHKKYSSNMMKFGLSSTSSYPNEMGIAGYIYTTNQPLTGLVKLKELWKWDMTKMAIYYTYVTNDDDQKAREKSGYRFHKTLGWVKPAPVERSLVKWTKEGSDRTEFRVGRETVPGFKKQGPIAYLFNRRSVGMIELEEYVAYSDNEMRTLVKYSEESPYKYLGVAGYCYSKPRAGYDAKLLHVGDKSRGWLSKLVVTSTQSEYDSYINDRNNKVTVLCYVKKA